MNPQNYITTTAASDVEAADGKKRNGRTIRWLCEGSKIDCKKFGRAWLVDPESLKKYIPGLQGFAAHPENNPRKKQPPAE